MLMDDHQGPNKDPNGAKSWILQVFVLDMFSARPDEPIKRTIVSAEVASLGPFRLNFEIKLVPECF
jgi:hypothetical protein